MIHLTLANYTRQPWKNGKGITTELWRAEKNGVLLVRLSRATVSEDGPFSVFPGIRRNLTVLSGPGFRLSGPGHDFRCDPLIPVAFPGDAPLTATETSGQPSDDFNVMTDHSQPPAAVALAQGVNLVAGGLLAIYALAPLRLNGRAMAPDDLILSDGPVTLQGDGPALAIRIHGLSAATIENLLRG